MPGITGMGTTYNLPNYVGELFQLSTEDTPFLSAIGGLTGGEDTGSTIFTWQTADLRDADETRQRLEGADAPTAEGRKRSSGSNVLEIHQEQVSVSYTKQGATRQLTGTDPMQAGVQPVTDELTFQTAAEIKQIARDVEKSFIVGTYNLPTDNTTKRRTRGILEAVTSNVVTNGTPAALTETMLLDLMQLAWENGGIQESETRTIVVGAKQKRALTKIFIDGKGYKESTRNVGGVNLQTIETDFGRCNIMLNRYMPAAQLAVVSLEECAPRFLEIPGKGHFFAESLAKTGASEKVQLYGEIGLKYGNELKHAKLTGLL
ncbi:SU10 major capsid protein [Rhodococcus erythropolis]|uniref:Uncharacterized protein n=1 Tax=Rhodococcus erythropolis (strain PR4 / NBRC 100887) TaxID=234621 RepID=C0ZX90_RHOE4|nr:MULTISPECIES: DUF5309 family protein [Rhodococcus erythropolis group]MCD2109338.1 DUF5309 domain-containing protein [Rhodococcus qingshengii]MCZ4528263.1 DUF5309 family protein [Rhodococcus erythropolis]BAH32975.1 hypothetical protein RER_22670 [Rhodococcus erythropolis PR4]